jgi:hypothetical protein
MQITGGNRRSSVGRILGGLIGAVVAPIAFYPFSKSLWVAVELTLRPVDQREPGDVPLSRSEPWG